MCFFFIETEKRLLKKTKIYILKGRRNTYFDFQNVGFIMRTNCLDTSNLYPFIPTIKFLSKFL